MEKLENKKHVTKAMILAGGLGTRFLPETLAIAKELVPIGNVPILMYHLEDLSKAGITDVLIVGNKLKEDSFKNFLNPPEDYVNKIESDGKLGLLAKYSEIMSKLKITYLNQDDELQMIDGEFHENLHFDERGSTVAVYTGKYWANGEPFMILNGDDLCLYPDGRSSAKEVIDIYEKVGGFVVYGKEVSRDQIYKYSSMVLGEKIGDKGAKMLDIVEKPERGTEPSNIMGFSRYIFESDFFDDAFSVPPRKNGEYCMTDYISKVAQEGRASTCIFDGDYFDCGSMAGYVCANLYSALSNPETNQSVKERAKKLLERDFSKGESEKDK